MKVLFVVPYVPDLVRTRPYNLIRSLAALGHEVTLLTLSTSPKDLVSMQKLRDTCKEIRSFPLSKWRSYVNCLLALPTRKPLQSVYCWQPAMADYIRNQIAGGADWDIVHVEHLRGVKYALMCQQLAPARSARIPVVWDSVDCISFLFRQASEKSRGGLSRLWTQVELSRTEAYEAWLLQQFSHILVTSSSDRQAFQALSSPSVESSTIHVLANGVDLDYFQPGKPAEREQATLVVSGKMSYHANVTMVLNLVQNIMPMVWDKRPEVKIWVVGKDPPQEILSLARNPAVIVTGTVEDIRPYLQRASLAVVPLVYGAGIQNKVLEAMACGTPVLATPRAVNALETLPGRDLFVEEAPSAFASRVVDLLDHPTVRQQVGQAGREFVESHHRWSGIAVNLENIYQQALKTRTN